MGGVQPGVSEYRFFVWFSRGFWEKKQRTLVSGGIPGKSPEFFFGLRLVFSIFLFVLIFLPMVIIDVQPKTSNYVIPTYLIPEK